MRVKVSGKFYDFFSEVKYTKALDSVAAVFSIKCSFEGSNKVHRELFRPLSFNPVEIYSNNNKLLLRGYVLNYSFKSSSKPELATLTGYSSSGVLQDVNTPLDAYPLEKNGMTLAEITESLLRLFDIKYTFSSNIANEMNEVYEKAVATPTEKIGIYLARLAKQRDIILSSTNDGNLYFYKLDLKSKKVSISLDANDTVTAQLKVNGQGMHSDITVVRQQSLPFLGFEEYNDEIVSNKSENVMVDFFRPRVVQLEDGSIKDVTTAAPSYIASELKNISLDVTIDKVLDVEEGDLIEYQNEEVYLDKKVIFVVGVVSFTETASTEQTVLTLYLPESYSSGVTQRIFGG